MFAIVYLRAKHAGATVLHMQLWKHDVLFNIDLWGMNHWAKKVYFLVDNWNSRLNCFNLSYLARLGQVKKNPIDLTYKVKFIRYKICLSIETYSDSDRSLTYLHLKQSDFGKK